MILVSSAIKRINERFIVIKKLFILFTKNFEKDLDK